MQLFLGRVYVFVGVFLQVSSQEVDSTTPQFLPSETAKTYSTKGVIAEGSTTMFSMASTSKGSATTPETGTVMTTQNSSTVATGKTDATVVSSSESSTTAPRGSTTAQKPNATTTESGHLTSTRFSTSNFTGNEASTTNTAAHKLTSETATASDVIFNTSDFRSTLPSVRPSEHNETTGYLSPTAPRASKFDAASFLGGIVLALGLCVIAVFGYRCYRNRRSTSPPYRIVDE